MRREIERLKGIRAGELVRISCSVGKGAGLSRVCIFSRAAENDEFSPHININPNLCLVGKPSMHKPCYGSISGGKRKIEIDVFAFEDIDIAVMQECDLEGDEKPKIGMKYVKTNKKGGWFFRDIGRGLRGIYAAWKACY